MGGVSKWPVLTDEDLSDTIPEVFAPPPEIIAGFMAQEAEDALLRWNPVMWGPVKARGLFVAGPQTVVRKARPRGVWQRALVFLRRTLFDRFGRG
jgi:tRNA(adenine34) deaminase